MNEFTGRVLKLGFYIEVVLRETKPTEK